MITGDQIRAGRALLRWSADDLAKASSVGLATVRRFEAVSGLPAGQLRVLEAIKSTLESAGIEFIGAPEDRPGVRLKFPVSRGVDQ